MYKKFKICGIIGILAGIMFFLLSQVLNYFNYNSTIISFTKISTIVALVLFTLSSVVFVIGLIKDKNKDAQ